MAEEAYMNLAIPVQPGLGKSAIEHPLGFDWFGQPARHRSSFSLWSDGAVLGYRFTTHKAPECELGQAGEFVEGLWEQDVAELFVMGPGGRYQEFNLSPCGAWWSAVFSGYRQRDRVVVCPSLRTDAVWGENGWTAELSVAISDIAVLDGPGLRDARLSVCGILAPKQPEYLCYSHTSGGEPDFHLARTFLPVELMQVE